MSEKRRTGLGKGLGALIPTAPTAARPVDVFFPDSSPAPRAAAVSQTPLSAVDQRGDSSVVADQTSTPNTHAPGGATQASIGAYFAELPIDDVHANANQPRQVFDEDDIAELAASIREVGVLQPIVVRPSGSTFEIVMGERRWRATRLAGLDTVPAIVRETSDTDLLRDALLENLHRAQLNPLEEAAAYQQLLEDFGCTHEELATRIARSRPQISNMLRLLRLPPAVQRRVAAGVLSAGHARALLGLTEPEAMERLAHRIVAEGLSVRATEEIVALGDADEPMRPELRRRPRAGEHTAALDDLSRRLSDRWDTKVKIALGQRKGRIAIEFANVEDLNRIMEALAPQELAAFPTTDGP
jgi:ParB family transcriptional regulator, chromosome partitioning protein